jgi:hypothetical protein
VARRIARVHIYLGTTILPQRELGDDETAHDIIECEIGPHEEVKELELVKVGPAYTRRMQTDDEAQQSKELWADGQHIGRELMSDFTPAPAPTGPRLINERVKGHDRYRYRIVTLEQTDIAGDAEAIEEAVPVPELPGPEADSGNTPT